MRGAQTNGVAGIIGECGGTLTCVTCHVHVDDMWIGRLLPASFAETELLEMVEDYRPNSRLSCQIVIDKHLGGMIVDIPPSSL